MVLGPLGAGSGPSPTALGKEGRKGTRFQSALIDGKVVQGLSPWILALRLRRQQGQAELAQERGANTCAARVRPISVLLAVFPMMFRHSEVGCCIFDNSPFGVSLSK